MQGANFTAGVREREDASRTRAAGDSVWETEVRHPSLSDSSEQPENQNDDKNRSEQTVRSVTKSITARREGSDQQQDENDKKN